MLVVCVFPHCERNAIPGPNKCQTKIQRLSTSPRVFARGATNTAILCGVAENAALAQMLTVWAFAPDHWHDDLVDFSRNG